MVTLILFLFVIGILVFVHELGHFLAAKISGIQVDEFALGFPIPIKGLDKIRLSFTKGETTYVINLLPFGGFVKMAGEGEYETKETKNPRGFEVQPAYKKLFVILAGVTMNFILACFIYTAFVIHAGFVQYVPQIVPDQFPFGHASSLVEFQADPRDTTSPIASHHLDKTYLFQSINGKSISSLSDVSLIVSQNKGKTIIIKYTDTQGNNPITLSIIPRTTVPKGKGAIGIILSPVTQLSFTGLEKPFSGILYSIDMLQYNIVGTSTLIGDAIKTKTASIVTSNITGPVGIYEVTGLVFQQEGFIGILNIIAILSLALAFMNVLPLPVLDGGYAVIIIIETILRREINPRVKGWINNVGIVLLVGLMLWVTANDIKNFDIISKIVHIFKR